MKNILLPTDFSETSINAMEYAVQLFLEEDCTFYVLNTYLPVYLYTPSVYESFAMATVDMGEIYKTQSEEGVNNVIDNLSDTFPTGNHDYIGISSFNTLYAAMESLALDYKIDCIVMGTKGATGLQDVFLGSQTMNTVKRSKVPVMGIPLGCTYQKPKDILFATNYETGSDQVGLHFLRDICTSHISRLIFLNVYYGSSLDDKQQENKYELDVFFKKQAHTNELSKPMSVVEAIKTFESKHSIDLLVMVHNKHNFFENLLFTPVVRKIVHHSPVPFLILPPVKTH